MDAKMLKLLACVFLIIPMIGYTQVYDDFSDGNFTDNPVWTGTESLFIVNEDFQLQLNGEGSGEASLFCSDSADRVHSEWHFYLREAFAPSGKNYCDIFLCDKYFLRFGESGSNDVVELWRLEENSIASVCRGQDTFIAAAFEASFKVTHDEYGVWKIYVDKNANGDYYLEAQGIDNKYETTGKFGIKATYTSSNAKRVYLDDVYFGPIIVDTTPPELKNVTVLRYNKVQLDFSEAVEDTISLNCDNYFVDNDIGKPMFAELNGSRSSVILSFKNTIQEEIHYTLTINKLQDIAGNISDNIQHTFLYYTTHENDIVINEIMADPEPVVGLPAVEYIELYNTRDYPINLKDWALVIATSEKVIAEDFYIQPEGFVLLCKDESVPFLEQYAQCIGFESFSITNSGVLLCLRDTDSKPITEVRFNISWYHDSAKSEGGWALEQIDPMSPCAGESNWRASCDGIGGTPGMKNSVDAPNPLIPKIDFIDVLSANSIEIYFNQRMDQYSMQISENYTVVETGGHPYSALCENESHNSVILTFEEDFSFQNYYKILVKEVQNCSGIPVAADCDFCFGLPVEVEAKDVIINEILFDPIAPANDYLELYNNSDKVFNLSDIKIGMVKTTFPNPPDTTIKSICSEHRQLLPEQYVLLTTTPSEIGIQYDCSTDNYLAMSSFPSYPNDGATAVILSNGIIIDEMSYSDKSHYPLLSVTKGVALERVNPDISSDDPANWHSAAFPKYGTPGFQNSVFIDNKADGTDVEIIPAVFSPDGDGLDDVTIINLNGFGIDYTAKITIFDSQGKFVRNLINCENIGDFNSFIWNGEDENGQIAPLGIYVVFVEVFDTHGDVKSFKKAVVLASK